MHFGLYAFDLFERIYDEAWEIEAERGPSALERVPMDAPLHEVYASKEDFLRDVPRLIVERNIHGVDIDPRAVQIAGLSLWLRAQRRWREQGVRAQDRPEITRSNIVCAEPMPGDTNMLKEFIARQLAATPEDRAIGEMLPPIFKAMTLAGEAGSLLKIEQEIAGVVEAARLRYEQAILQQRKQGDYLPGFAPERDTTLFDLIDLPKPEEFWPQAEGRIYAALESYAGFAEGDGAYRRRLFADDAAQGFAFIDLCRRRYDVVLMNPPFGSPSNFSASVLSKDAAGNMYPAFVLRGMEICIGLVGAISDRTFIVQQSFSKFRRRLVSREWGLFALVELGWGVLDDADVQVAMYFLGNYNLNTHLFTKIRTENNIGEIPEYLQSDILWRVLSQDVMDKIPNQAFAYTLPDVYLYSLEHHSRLSQLSELPRGLGSNDADRTYKAWYEVPITDMGENKKYRSLSNGGSVSPFFRETAAVAEWIRRDGKLLVEEGYSKENLAYDQKNYSQYFIEGLSFSKQSSVFNVAILTEDSIPTREGKAILPKNRADTLLLLAYLNSSYVRYFVDATNGLHKQSGPVGMTPVPQFPPLSKEKLSQIVLTISCKLMSTYKGDEASRYFVMPFMNEGVDVEKISFDVDLALEEIDEIVFDVLQVPRTDRLIIKKTPKPAASFYNSAKFDWFGYIIGVLYGRWDIRYATGERSAPELPDPFAPLPVCPPGMLQNAQGLPAVPEDVPASYPLRISWHGILVDDAGHAEDIAGRVREAIGVIWGERAEAIEQEACEILGVTSLREYLRRPAGFFADHLSRYSKSRRQAPIYWPLAVGSNYTIWLSYHRLTDQTLYRCVNDFIDPKLNIVSGQWAVISQKSERTAREEKELEQLRDLIRELTELRAEILRVAVFWKPNLNDGVQISAAPLWRLFSHKPWQKKLKETWESLERGDYDWAHLAYSIWPARVREKCITDKSLAIAHGLEEVYVEVAAGKAKRGKKKQAPEDEGMFEGEERDRL